MIKPAFLVIFLFAVVYTGYAQNATRTIRVEAPLHTPPEDSLLVIGNQFVWGYWIYPKSPVLKRLSVTNLGMGLPVVQARMSNSKSPAVPTSKKRYTTTMRMLLA